MIDEEHSTKLIEAKIRFAQERRFMASEKLSDTSGRLPPGQSRVKGLPVLDLGIHPEIDLATWALVIDGAVETPVRIKWEHFNTLDQATIETDIHCVTSWSSFDNQWSGVSLATLLDLVKPRSKATHVMFHATDGYTTNVPIEDLLQDNCMVATAWNGEPLSDSHGGPARLVIPHLYFWKSAKWVCRIELLEADAPGYWEKRGYHNDGDPWQEQRYGARIDTPQAAPVELAPTLVEPVKPPKLGVIERISAWVNYHFFPY